MNRETRKLVASFGERFRKELEASPRLPLQIALMLEHLRRAENERRY